MRQRTALCFASIALLASPSSGLAETRIASGKVQSVSGTERTLAIVRKAEDGETTQEFEISRKAKITIDGVQGSLDELEPGQQVKVSFDDKLEVATSIEATSQKLDFVPLFDGRTLKGWRGDLSCWSVAGAAIVGTGKSENDFRNYLSTSKTYKNFVLRAKCKVTSADSGIVFRGKPNSLSGLQVLTGKFAFGCLMDETGVERGEPFKMVTRNDGEKKRAEIAAVTNENDWNDFTITAIGDQLKCEVNGYVSFDLKYPSRPKSGVISLKVRTKTRVAFKDIQIAELP